ncbi:MAG: hypothetical protein AABZ39_07570 [Spirochaetota bacterium]
MNKPTSNSKNTRVTRKKAQRGKIIRTDEIDFKYEYQNGRNVRREIITPGNISKMKCANCNEFINFTDKDNPRNMKFCPRCRVKIKTFDEQKKDYFDRINNTQKKCAVCERAIPGTFVQNESSKKIYIPFKIVKKITFRGGRTKISTCSPACRKKKHDMSIRRQQKSKQA